jgi:hypothetical protein
LLSLKAESDWWTHLLQAHNNSYKLRLSRSLRLTLTTRTGLLLAGFESKDRGVLFTPRLGFEIVGASDGFESYPAPMTNRLQLGVGYGNWWGFQGGHHATGWTLVVGVAVLWAV